MPQDTYNDRRRERAFARRTPCVDCGQPSEGTRCLGCFHLAQRTGEARRLRISALWEEGYTIKQIASQFATSPGTINVAIARMRKEGRQLSYRRRSYARFPHSAGTWQERLALMAEHRAEWGREPGYIPDEARELLANDPCAYCGAEGEVVDHIVPKIAGGPDVIDNFTAACGACNTAKQGMPLLMFLLWRQVKPELQAAERLLRLLRSADPSPRRGRKAAAV